MANSFPASGLAYADQFAVGRSSGTGLLNTFLSNDLNTIQIRAESDTSGVVSYLGMAPAFLEYYRNATTGVDLTIQTKIQAAGGGGAIVFSPNSPSADLTPVERMRITKAGNVGIGASSPAAKLHLCGSGDNIFRGESTTTGTVANLFVTKAGVTGVGYYAGVNVTGGAPGGWEVYDAICNVSRLYIKSEGSMGIGTCTPTYKLHVNGTFYAAGSSQDYKEGVCKYDTDSCMFMKLKPVTYQYKEEFKHLGKELKSQTQIGLIAEEVAEVAPELAILVKENDNDVVRNVDYEKLTIVLLSEVQKLRKELDDLKTK